MPHNVTTYTTSATITDAEFRAFIQILDNVFEASDLIRATGVGTQIDPLTATFPGVNNTYAGYQIWEFADAQQGSYPIKSKIEYGRGASASALRLKITVATGFNSSGVATGTTLFTFESEVSNAAATYPITVSARDKFIYIFIRESAGYKFLVERSVDASGAPTNKGIGLCYRTKADSNQKYQFVYYSGVSQPAVESGQPAGGALMPTAQSNGQKQDGTDPAIYPQLYMGLGETYVSAVVGMIFRANCTLNNVNTNITILGVTGCSIIPRAADEVGAFVYQRNTSPSTVNTAYYVRCD